MDKLAEKSTSIMSTEPYEAPRVEVIELDIEDAVLTGTSSMTYEEF